ncbi:MAG: glycolate oxidase subunit GlcF [Alphaproteobacteria bacterium]|nr:glycolate oxidase subunit GlcF [Alphaproteobacteria bacterium]
MQTNFTEAQLQNPDNAASEQILRKCVHCGFCTATCPTYVLLGDELDSPRGRIYLIKDMLENDKPANEKIVTHIDRCLSCLSCMSTCPSGVNYMHLVDHARKYIEETYERPWHDRMLRSLLAFLLPKVGLFRVAMIGAMIAKPLAPLFPAKGKLARMRAMLELAPNSLPSPSPTDRPGVHAADTPRRKRVALLTGCAQRALNPEINESTIRLLTRHGCDVVVSDGIGCCGALTHHMGKEDLALAAAKANIDAWTREIEGQGLDAIVINASGCGTTVKDYGFMLREDPVYAEKAEKVAALTKDISEVMTDLGLGAVVRETAGIKIAYHAACSLQHGQQIKTLPKRALRAAGFQVVEPIDPHLCCGSAGTYNLLQPEIAGQLKDRKVETLEKLKPDVIAAGNIGCMTQIQSGTGVPVVHTATILDWATGGPVPQALEGVWSDEAVRPAQAMEAAD